MSYKEILKSVVINKIKKEVKKKMTYDDILFTIKLIDCFKFTKDDSIGVTFETKLEIYNRDDGIRQYSITGVIDEISGKIIVNIY